MNYNKKREAKTSYDIKKIAENVIREFEENEKLEVSKDSTSSTEKNSSRKNECLLHSIFILLGNIEKLSNEIFLLLYFELTKEFERRFSRDTHPVMDTIAKSLLDIVAEEAI